MVAASCAVTALPYTAVFVSSIPTTGASAPTVMSLSDDPWCVTEGTSFDPPAMRRATVSSMLVDGDTYPSSVYANRILQLRLACQAATPDDLATQLQALIKQLDKPTNILRVTQKTSTPVYFRTFRVSPGNVDIITRSQRIAQVAVDIPAEPFAYGPREILTQVLVTNNPVTGVAHPMYFDVTGVKGDVETPLVLTIDNDAPGSSGGPVIYNTGVIAIRRGGNPNNMPFVFQAEQASMGTDTTVQPNDAAMSGSGNNYVSCTFATDQSMQTRIFFNNVPALASTDARGEYRMLVRTRRHNFNSIYQARTVVGTDAFGVTGDTVAIPSTVALQRQIVDLGLISLPVAIDPVVDGYSGTELPIYGAGIGVQISCQSVPVSGCSSLDLDYVILTPADDAWLNVRWPFSTSFSGTWDTIIDSVTETVWVRDTSGAVRDVSQIPVVGGFPYVSPDVTNRIFFVREVSRISQNNELLTNVTAITPSYWPRYLDPIKPVAT